MSDLKPLLPCPFCGGNAVTKNISGDYGYTPDRIELFCEKCKATSGVSSLDTETWTEEKRNHSIYDQQKLKIITAWNTRPIEDALQKKIDNLQKLLQIKTEVNMDIGEQLLDQIDRLTKESIRSMSQPGAVLNPAKTIETIRNIANDAVEALAKYKKDV